jgi:hypothetical protein
MPETMMQFQSAGYFLVEPVPRPTFADASLLPKLVTSISTCICSLHPPMALMPWIDTTGEDAKDYRKFLDVPEKIFLDATREAEQLFNDEKFGWDSVFYDSETAISFYKKYLYKIPSVRLMQALIPVESVSNLVSELTNESFTPHGIGFALQSKNYFSFVPEDLDSYKVLCFDMGTVHSFICNSLERKFFDELSICLNKNGLIVTLEDAIRASKFCNSEESGAEPGCWFPCGLLEIALPNEARA